MHQFKFRVNSRVTTVLECSINAKIRNPNRSEDEDGTLVSLFINPDLIKF